MRRTSALFIILALTSPAIADTKIEGHMEPLPYELLEQPIKLNHHCAGAAIIEWRATTGRSDTTAPSNKATKVVNEACNLALSKIESFAKESGLVANYKQIKIKISLIPADITFQGRDYRNLNDRFYRFKYRDRQDVKYVWGYAAENGHLYVRNDVLDSSGKANYSFQLVFTHELWHIYSFQSGIFDQFHGDAGSKSLIDEQMAQNFTEYLGFGR